MIVVTGDDGMERDLLQFVRDCIIEHLHTPNQLPTPGRGPGIQVRGATTVDYTLSFGRWAALPDAIAVPPGTSHGDDPEHQRSRDRGLQHGAEDSESL